MIKKVLISISSFIVRSLLKVLPPAVSNDVKTVFFTKIERYNDSFLSYHLRPKKTENVTFLDEYIFDDSDIGIVMQGPPVFKDSFTLETLKLYKRTFPKSMLIYSTWEIKDDNFKSELLLLNVILLENDLPSNNGPLNVNYQIVSTREGVKRAKELGVRFVLKTRSDQRIYKSGVGKFLKETIFRFKDSKYPKLISVNINTLKYRPLGIGDMCMFGSIEDMINYWDCKLDPRKGKEYSLKPDESILDHAHENLAETYLCRSYLKKIGVDCELTLENTWYIYKKYFIVIDHQLLDLFWFKYDYHVMNRFEYYYPHSYQLFSYLDWTLSTNSIEIREKLLNNLEGKNL